MRNFRLPMMLALLVGAIAAPLRAQQIGQMTRVTPTTGLADSTLFACTDSTKALARACKFSDVQKRLSYKAFDSLVTGNIRITGTCTGCGGGGGATVSDTVRAVTFDSVRALRVRSDTIRSQSGVSHTLTFQTTTSASAVKNSLVLGADSSATFLGVVQVPTGTTGGLRQVGGGNTRIMFTTAGDTIRMLSNGSNRLSISTTVDAAVPFKQSCFGSASAPCYDIQPNLTGNHNGMYLPNTDTLGFTTGSVANLRLTGGASSVLLGGAGNMTIQAGTGANRTLTLQSSNNSSVATSFLAGAGDTVKFSGHAIAASFTAAAGTPGTLCYNTATNEITKNNATSCVVSSLRFKTDVNTISREWASGKLMALRASSFTYKDGGRHALGLIAENADSVDSRLGFRNPDGTVNSFDQPGVLALLVATVQRQQLQIDSLRAEIHPRRKP